MSHHGNSATFAIPKSIKVYSFWNPYHYKKKMILHPVAAKHRMDRNYNCGIFSRTWPPKSPDTSSAPNVWLEYKINTQDIFLLLLILLRIYLFRYVLCHRKFSAHWLAFFRAIPDQKNKRDQRHEISICYNIKNISFNFLRS